MTELDFHEEASPEDGDQEQGDGTGLESWTSVALQLFPNGGATPDIVFVTVLLSSWDSGNCMVWWSLRNAGRTLP